MTNLPPHDAQPLLVANPQLVGRQIDPLAVFNKDALDAVGLTPHIVASAVTFVHRILDDLDRTLVTNGETRLAQMVELANLSAIIGNLLRTGVARASAGVFVANGPHRYPDLLCTKEGCGDLEIKVALETNKPKGHLVKPGPHMICRYVLGRGDGEYTPGKETRGDVVWIWEIRAGILREGDFNESNTPGDSGKTAVINAAGMSQLHPVFCSLAHFPAGKKTRAAYEVLMQPLPLGA